MNSMTDVRQRGPFRNSQPGSVECSVITQRASCVSLDLAPSRADQTLCLSGLMCFSSCGPQSKRGRWRELPPVRGSEPEREVSHREGDHEGRTRSWKYPEASALSKLAKGRGTIPGGIRFRCTFICTFSTILRKTAGLFVVVCVTGLLG